MNKTHCFIKDGQFCCVPIDMNNTPEQQSFKGYAIVSQKPKNMEDFDKNELLSKYLLNIKYLHCSYSKNINEQCLKMLDDIYAPS